MPGSNELSLSSRIQETTSMIFNRNVMTYLIIALLLITLGLINFSDLSNITLDFNRLVTVSFWTTFFSRFIGSYILKYIFIGKGKKLKKEENEHKQIQNSIIECKKLIEKDNRIEEFREYVEEEVNLHDLIESYDRLLKNKKHKKSKKLFGIILTKRRKKLIDEIHNERKKVAYLRGALNSKDPKRIEEALKDINIEEISIKGRPEITSDTMFDGVKYDDEEVLSPLTFNEGKETIKKIIGNPFLTLLSFGIVTVMFNDFVFSTDDWMNKVINILITIIIWMFISIFAFDNGVSIIDKLIQSKEIRLRYFKEFLSRPKKIYLNKEKTQQEEPIELIESDIVENTIKED